MRKHAAFLVMLLLLLVTALPAVAAAPPVLTVTVTGLQGVPVEGARVQLMVPGAGMVDSAPTVAGRATLNPAPVSATTYWVRVWGPNHTTVDRPWVPAADGNRLTVSLTPLSAGLAGLVVDHLGLPVAGARVSAWHAQLGLLGEATTDAHGAYSLSGLTAPGPYQLQVVAAGFRPYAGQPAPLTAGKTRQADVTLVPNTATVTGQIVDSYDLEPVAGARVELLRKGWGLMAVATAAEDGTFALTAAPSDAAEYQVRIWAHGYYTLSQPFALAPGAHKEFTGQDRFVLVETSYLAHQIDISGVVEDDQGAPLSGATVTLYHMFDEQTKTVTSGDDGRFTFTEVEVSAKNGYALEVSKAGYFTAADSFPDTAKDEAEVTVRLRPATAQVQGRVADTWGAPLAGAAVTLVSGEGTYQAVSNADGFYTVAGVPASPGDLYLVKAAGAGSRTVTAAEGPVVLAGQRSRTIDLMGVATAAVAGVVAGPDGAPLAGATVELWHEGEGAPAAVVTADAFGAYRFDSLIPGDRYSVVASAAGYRTSAAAPSEPSVTPLFRAVAGSVRQADVMLGR